MSNRVGINTSVPPAHLVSSSFLTAQQLAAQYNDFHNNLRYFSAAPALVFERLVDNLSEAFNAILERVGNQHAAAHPTCQLCSHTNLLRPEEEELNNPRQRIKVLDGIQELGDPPPYECVASSSTTGAVITSGRSGPGIGSFSTLEVRLPHQQRSSTSRIVSFTHPYRYPPGLAFGLKVVDIGKEHNARVKTFGRRVDKDEFDVRINTWLDTKLYSAECVWLEIDQADDPPLFEYGSYDTLEDHPLHEPQEQNSRHIAFYETYLVAPTVVVWLTAFDMSSEKDWRIKAYATDVTETGFKINIDTWEDSVLYSAVATWVAYVAGMPGVCSGVFSTDHCRASKDQGIRSSGQEQFGNNSFDSPPRVLLALNSFEIDHGGDLRLLVKASDVTAAGMTWHLDAWGDTVLYSAGASYIALS